MKAIRLLPGDTASIGSLPFDTTVEAADLLLSVTPALPAVPSLPRRSPAEFMIAQAAAGLRGITVLPDGQLHADAGKIDPFDPVIDPLPAEPHATSLEFLDLVADRTDPIKLQVTGPITLGVALMHAGVDPGRAFSVAGSAARARADALVHEAMSRVPMAPQYVFVDEPGLAAASEPGFPLSPDETIDLISGVLAAIEPHGVTGLHCCGPADWRLAQQSGPQILSLPVDMAVEAHAGTFAAHLERGGWIAWGAVPTDGPVSAGPEVPWKHLGELWCQLVVAGCDPVLLREQALVTPACGLAIHTPAQAAHVLGLAAEVGRRIQMQSLGLRLTVGA